MTEKLLTVKELADILDVNTESIYREIKRPECKIPFHKRGASYRFILSDVLNATKGNDEKEINN